MKFLLKLSNKGTGTNQIILSGDKKQTIKANNHKWQFNELIIRNTSDEGVYSDDLTLIGGNMDLNGHTLTVRGNLR